MVQKVFSIDKDKNGTNLVRTAKSGNLYIRGFGQGGVMNGVKHGMKAFTMFQPNNDAGKAFLESIEVGDQICV